MALLLFRGVQRTGAMKAMSTFLRSPSASFVSVSSRKPLDVVQSPSFVQAAPATTIAKTAHGPYNQGEPYRLHSHTSHWSIERVIDVALLPLLPIAFVTDNVVANYLLIIGLGAHVHWGLEAIIVDYCRPRVVGHFFYYLGLAVVYSLSVACITGLLYLNYTQMPPTKAIKKLWTL